MRMSRAATPLAVAVVLAACAGDTGQPTDPVTLEGIEPDEDAGPEDAAGPVGDAADEDDAGGDDVVEGAAPTAAQLPVDLGPIGTATVEVLGDELVLADLQLASGWRETSREADGDELEVELRSEDGEATFEVELDGDRVEIHLDVDLEDVAPGAFALPDGGRLVVSVSGDDLRLDELTPGEGWEVTDRDVDDDEVEVELRRGEARWRIEVEADDGRVDVTIDAEERRRR
jgi:hypothetical protein